MSNLWVCSKKVGVQHCRRRLAYQLHHRHHHNHNHNALDWQKTNLSGGESNPGLLRVVLSNDKQKY
jgi:hypothetical protein